MQKRPIPSLPGNLIRLVYEAAAGADKGVIAKENFGAIQSCEDGKGVRRTKKAELFSLFCEVGSAARAFNYVKFGREDKATIAVNDPITWFKKTFCNCSITSVKCMCDNKSRGNVPGATRIDVSPTLFTGMDRSQAFREIASSLKLEGDDGRKSCVQIARQADRIQHLDAVFMWGKDKAISSRYNPVAISVYNAQLASLLDLKVHTVIMEDLFIFGL